MIIRSVKARYIYLSVSTFTVKQKVEEKDMTGRQFSQVQQAMIEEEKWAAPSMTYFRPHFMVCAAIISINVVAITLLITIIIITIIITRCLPLVMAMQGHMIPRL